MKLSQETIDKESSLPKQQAKITVPEKQSVVFHRNNRLFIPTNKNKTELKEIKDREIAHRCLYWFTLNP